MPIWADPARGPAVRLVADDDMTLLGMFVAPPAVRPTAADLRMVAGTDPARFAEIVRRDLPGVRTLTRMQEAAALVDAGAEVVSTAVHMVRPRLQDDPPPLSWAGPTLAAGIRMTPVDRPVEEIAAAQRLGFPAGHPEHEATLEAQASGALESLLAGDLMGPVYDDASALLVDADDEIVACLIVTLWEGIGEEWKGGPWGVDLFRLPGAGPGLVGRALLARAVTVAHLDGHGAMGLTVDAGNRARLLYERLGFRSAFHRVTLDLPGAWPAASEG